MDKKVLVVTGLDLGWDCVVGVFENTTEEALREIFPEGKYVINTCYLESNFKTERYR